MRQFGDAQLELGEEEDGDGALEGGVHSPLKFYNLERLVAFQFAAAPVKASKGERSISR